MPEVLFNNDDVTVLGPPNTVEVLVDIGATGTRGSQTFVGVGDPNIIVIGQTPLINDLFINTSPGADYAYLYQYVSEPGGNTWVKTISLNPVIYSKNHAVIYSIGIAQVIIPISEIVTVTGAPLTAENFSVQYSIAHTSPIASAMAIPALAGPGTDLVINFKAVEHTTDSGPAEWIDLDGEVTTHIFITIV